MKKVVEVKRELTLGWGMLMYRCKLECGCERIIHPKKVYGKIGTSRAEPPTKLKCYQCESGGTP